MQGPHLKPKGTSSHLFFTETLWSVEGDFSHHIILPPLSCSHVNPHSTKHSGHRTVSSVTVELNWVEKVRSVMWHQKTKWPSWTWIIPVNSVLSPCLTSDTVIFLSAVLATGNMNRSKNCQVKNPTQLWKGRRVLNTEMTMINIDSSQQGQGPFILPLLPECLLHAPGYTGHKDKRHSLCSQRGHSLVETSRQRNYFYTRDAHYECR